MPKTFYINCPFCEGMVEVNSATGEIVQKWETGQKKESGDKMTSALKKMEDAKKRRSNLFDQTQADMKGQKKKREDAFKDQVKRVKEEGPQEKPVRPMDLD